MIKIIRISNIAVVATVEVDLGPGLTVLSGETGAGKSIVVDALGLLLGERASSDLLRTGTDRASVEALIEFEGADAWLEGHGLPNDGGDLVLRREVLSSGKGRATVNGALVPVALLRELAPRIAEIHGQHEPQGLLDPTVHLEHLDQFGSLMGARAIVAERFVEWRRAEDALASMRRDRREIERRKEILEFQLREIDRAQAVVGEEEALRREKSLQANADRLLAATEEAYAVLYDAEDAILTRLSQVFRRLGEAATLDPALAALAESRAEVVTRLEDVALQLRDYRERIQVLPGRLDQIEARLATLEQLKRKYGATVEDVLEFAERCREELAALESPEDLERKLVERATAGRQAYLVVARDLSRRRRAAAKELSSRVKDELRELAMERARFEVAFDPTAHSEEPVAELNWGSHGLELAEFILSSNPGEDLRPLAKIASGGELSRILLALRCASLGQHGRTLVFDEVDAGIGGRVAEMVGRKLQRLARDHQILCVTHLPQIAAFADNQLVVEKAVLSGRTNAGLRRLDAPGRIEEVARMLGGETITDAARQHAREMLDAATGTSAGTPSTSR